MFGFKRTAGSIAAAVTAVVAVALASPAAAQEAPVGGGSTGDVAFAFVGRIEQNGLLLVNFGYVTSAAGVDSADLFTGDDPLERSEATARITYFSSTRIDSRSVNDNLFVTSGTAETTFYFQPDGGADFTDPTSFENGTEIATTEGAWNDIVNVIEPNTGVVTAESDETQLTAGTFTLDGEEYPFGAEGLGWRLSSTGLGIRTDAETPVASFVYAGQATVTASDGEAVADDSTSEAAGDDRTGTDDEDDDDTPAATWVSLGVAIVALVLAAGALARSRGRPASQT